MPISSPTCLPRSLNGMMSGMAPSLLGRDLTKPTEGTFSQGFSRVWPLVIAVQETCAKPNLYEDSICRDIILLRSIFRVMYFYLAVHTKIARIPARNYFNVPN